MTARTEQQAIAKVAREKAHVVPQACFITHVNNTTGWNVIEGTGCAHWVAHQKGIQRGTIGDGHTCHIGFPTRVPDVTRGLATVAPAAVQVDDIWAGSHRSQTTGRWVEHCGIVTNITPGTPVVIGWIGAVANSPPFITITNDSSNAGGVVQSDWARDFNSGGQFYR